MSASTAGAIKALLEAAGLGISVYRDTAPQGQALPYVTVQEGISFTDEPAFSAYDDPEHHVVEEVQVNVWQLWRNTTTRAVQESYTLADAVTAALEGAQLSTLPTFGGLMALASRQRLVEEDNNIIHDAITVEVRRTLSRRP